GLKEAGLVIEQEHHRVIDVHQRLAAAAGKNVCHCNLLVRYRAAGCSPAGMRSGNAMVAREDAQGLEGFSRFVLKMPPCPDGPSWPGARSGPARRERRPRSGRACHMGGDETRK